MENTLQEINEDEDTIINDIPNFTPEVTDDLNEDIQLIKKPEVSIVCTSFKSLSILKFIIRRNFHRNADSTDSNSKLTYDNDIKLIFIGPRLPEIVDILNKLEKKKSISKMESDALSHAVPYWSTKFGNIAEFDTYFIYSYIETNIPIYHVRIILYETLRTKFNLSLDAAAHYLPHNLLIYKYSRIIEYKHFINILNYIFEDNKVLDNKLFFTKLGKFTLLDNDGITKLIKMRLPLKYKTVKPEVNPIQFTLRKQYTYEDMLNSEEL